MLYEHDSTHSYTPETSDGLLCGGSQRLQTLCAANTDPLHGGGCTFPLVSLRSFHPQPAHLETFPLTKVNINGTMLLSVSCTMSFPCADCVGCVDCVGTYIGAYMN